jgi:hypothetical protein
MIAKVLLTVLAGATLLAAGVAIGPGTAMAHDCREGWDMSSSGSGDHDGQDDDCLPSPPTPNPIDTPAATVPQGAIPTETQPPLTTEEPPALAPPGAAPTVPMVPAPARAPVPNGAPPVAGRPLADPQGGSWFPLALGSLAVLALLALIRAGFRARRKLEGNLDDRSPGD